MRAGVDADFGIDGICCAQTVADCSSCDPKMHERNEPMDVPNSTYEEPEFVPLNCKFRNFSS